MSLIKTRFSKTVLALVLALILAVSLMPALSYQASAATYYVATGVVTDAGMSTITILSSGKHRNFSKEDAKVVDPYKKGLALGDTVKIAYNAKHPNVALQINVIAHAQSDNRQPHDTVTTITYVGTVRDVGMSTISILVNAKRYNFSKEDAHIVGANDGIMVGDKVRVTAYSNNPSMAVQILMITQGSGHNGGDSGSDSNPWGFQGPIPDRSFSGLVTDMDTCYIIVQDLRTNKSQTFYYDDMKIDLSFINIGDVVKIYYNSDNPSGVLKAEELDYGY